jgi:hypothetical protein
MFELKATVCVLFRRAASKQIDETHRQADGNSINENASAFFYAVEYANFLFLANTSTMFNEPHSLDLFCAKNIVA